MTVEAQKLAATSDVGAGMATMIKDAFLAALLTLGLCFPVVALHAESDNDGNLYLIPRPLLVAVICGLVFAGRLGMSLYQARPKVEQPRVVAVAAPKSAALELLGRYASVIGLVFLFVFPLATLWLLGPAGSLKWINNYGIQILIYVMLGWGLNIVVGLAGLLDLGYVAFYAVGAYSYALLAKNFGLSFWILLPLAGILSSFWGILLGFPVLRLRGDYLAIVTLAFGEMIRLVLINWVDLTGGPNGVSGIPRPTLFGTPPTTGEDALAARLGIEFSPTQRIVFLFYLILALALLTNWVTIRLRRLPIGRAWEALREDEVACRALGINITTTKLTA